MNVQDDYRVARMRFAEILGPRPRRRAAQDVAIRATAERLVASQDPVDTLAAYILAVEYEAYTAQARPRGTPTAQDFERAIAVTRGIQAVAAEGSPAERSEAATDFGRRVHGGAVLMAASIWTDRAWSEALADA